MVQNIRKLFGGLIFFLSRNRICHFSKFHSKQCFSEEYSQLPIFIVTNFSHDFLCLEEVFFVCFYFFSPFKLNSTVDIMKLDFGQKNKTVEISCTINCGIIKIYSIPFGRGYGTPVIIPEGDIEI